jgi:hypothetical protein
MPIDETKALEILAELIKKPESRAEDIPTIWGEIIKVYNDHFAPPIDEPKKKKRRKRTTTSPNLGWPAGVSRAEYKEWKAQQETRGVADNVNPQEYKRLRDAGLADLSEPEPEPLPAPAPARRGRPKKAV